MPKLRIVIELHFLFFVVATHSEWIDNLAGFRGAMMG